MPIQWISVEDSLPTHKERVYVWVIPREQIVEVRFKDGTFESDYGDLWGPRTAADVDHGYDLTEDRVTHWTSMNGPDS